MARVIKYYGWSEELQDYVQLPLDYADTWTMSLARQVNGRNLTEEQFLNICKLHCTDVNPQFVGG